jgi:hypothetical protein
MESKIQFIPAQPGWLALFEDSTDEGVAIHAEPVLAWCLGAGEAGDGHRLVSFGQAVIGAGPWIDKAEKEKAARFFALVREEQLDADVVAELAGKAHLSREDLLERALENHESRQEGHRSWVHDRRSQRAMKFPAPTLRIF